MAEGLGFKALNVIGPALHRVLGSRLRGCEAWGKHTSDSCMMYVLSTLVEAHKNQLKLPMLDVFKLCRGL